MAPPEACATQPFSAQLIQGPQAPELAYEWRAVLHLGNDITQVMPFSGSENDQTLTVLKAGVVAVCYCATFDENNLCADDAYFIRAAKVTVRGPKAGANLVFPTNFVVRVDLEGWGFEESNTIRFIGTTQTCNENGFAPNGVMNYRLGCPGRNQSDCRQPEQLEDIRTIVDSANSTGIYLLDVKIDEFDSVCTFSGPITDHLQDGDSLTIDPATILLSERPQTNWTPAEAHLVAKLAGVYGYPDQAGERLIANRVWYMYRTSGALIKNQLVMNVGWDPRRRPSFSFAGSGGIWTRRNRLRTNEELKVEMATSMKVCWATREEGIPKYYADAGTVTFRDPTYMGAAGTHLTATVQNNDAPFVISFSPRTGRLEYRELEVPMVLRLLFRDTAGRLEPLLTGALGSKLESLDPDDEVKFEDATQALCGKLFAEIRGNLLV